MKTEPDVFSFDDLVKAPKKTTSWEGVRNYQARNFMRDQFKKGDLAFIYHSNTEEPAIVGIAEVVKEGYPDASAWDPKSEYFDSDAKKKGTNPWILVDVKAVQRLKNPLTREILKADTILSKMMVMQKGSRLSVQPVEESHYKRVLAVGKPESV